MTPPQTLPPIGFGTYSDENREQWRDNVALALETGYRFIDTAEVYRNEQYVGEAIRRSAVPREEVFLETKTVHHDVPERAEQVGEAIDGCLDRLGVEYVDLLYVHWPSGIYSTEDVLPYFEDAYTEGKTRGIGLSNFSPALIDEARDFLDVPVSTIQVEMHPLLQQEELLAYTRDHGLNLVAYCPLAQGEVGTIPEIQEIADAHDVSPAQVSLAWLRSKGVIPIPKASSRAHIEDNYASLDLSLTQSEQDRIDAIDRERRFVDAGWGPWNC